MIISKQTTVKQIKKEFADQFPGLKIELYKNMHFRMIGSANKDLILDEVKVEDINPDLVKLEFIISPASTVAEFEQLLQEEFSLNVQVFRKSNDIYLQTISTDHWTLATQNSKGMHSTQNDKSH